MQPARALLSLALCAVLAPAITSPVATAAAAPPKPVEIAYDEFTLPNGLRVVVNIMGRARTCSPGAAVRGYPAC